MKNHKELYFTGSPAVRSLCCDYEHSISMKNEFGKNDKSVSARSFERPKK